METEKFKKLILTPMETEKLKNPALIAYPHGILGTIEFFIYSNPNKCCRLRGDPCDQISCRSSKSIYIMKNEIKK